MLVSTTKMVKDDMAVPIHCYSLIDVNSCISRTLRP
jgi:hypothetical protein